MTNVYSVKKFVLSLSLFVTMLFLATPAVAGSPCSGCNSGICCSYDGLICEDDVTFKRCGSSYCGIMTDNCGNTFDCGGCTYPNDICHGSGEGNLCCGPDQRVYQYFCCTPKQTCESLGKTCGTIDDGWNTCGRVTCGPPCTTVKNVPASSPPMTLLLGGVLAAFGLVFIRRKKQAS
jgi:hypothetical protein